MDATSKFIVGYDPVSGKDDIGDAYMIDALSEIELTVTEAQALDTSSEIIEAAKAYGKKLSDYSDVTVNIKSGTLGVTAGETYSIEFELYGLTGFTKTVTTDFVVKSALQPVTFSALQTGGTSGTADSTGIVLTFDTAVTGLTASDITIMNGTGAATKGALSGSGTTWTIALTSVTTQGNVSVSVADFGTFDVTTAAQSVAVYKDTRTTVDKSALYAALKLARTINHGGVNTTAAWTNFVNAVSNASTVYGNASATQTEVDNATEVLNAAILALKHTDNSKYFEKGVRKHKVGSKDNLVHVIIHDWALHTGVVKVDGNTLTLGTDYTSVTGSTRTTLLASYLDTLSLGTHTLTVEYSDGIDNISDSFVIVAAEVGDGDNNKGDGDNNGDGNNNNGSIDDNNSGNNTNSGGDNNSSSEGDSPRTGDDMNFALLITLCGGALLVLSLLMICQRKLKR
jgi:hypothetical protein